MNKEHGMKMPLLTNENHQQLDNIFENVNVVKITNEKRRSDPGVIVANHISQLTNVTTSSSTAKSSNSSSRTKGTRLKPPLPHTKIMSSRVHVVSSNPNQMGSSPQPMSLHAQPSSNSTLNGTSSAIFCRICYTNESKESLMNWCNCSGTMGLMHKSCLERWLSQSNSNKCEICKYEFKVDKVPRSFKQWLCRPISFRENKNLLNDLVCFLILTPLAVISTWYCILFALKFHETENRWEASGLVVLTSFLLFIYVLWFSFSCKYHYKVFREWQKKNQIVTIKMNEDRVVINMASTSSANQRSHQQQQLDTNEAAVATETDITRAESIVSLRTAQTNDQLLKFDDDDDRENINVERGEKSIMSPGFQTSSISIDLNNRCTIDSDEDDDAPIQLSGGIPMNSISKTKLKRQSTLNIDAAKSAISTVEI